MARVTADARSSTGASYRWVVLVFAILAYATSHFARQNYTGIQKFIQEDFAIDRGMLGLMGAVFFYTYALAQVPWGMAADRLGSRGVTATGILLTAATMAGFATSQSEGALLFWRTMAGIAGAAAYVSLAGGLARWFPPHQRGLSQSAFGGVGGALGEGTAFFLLPVLSIYLASGWRQGTNAMAMAIAAMGVLCFVFLRSAPAGQAPTTRRPLPFELFRDPRLWSFCALFAGFMVGIRTSQAWIAVYLSDVYASTRGLDLNGAVVAGGMFATLAFSLIGRGLCVPIAGRLSDYLVARGISRIAVVIAWLAVVIVLFQILSLRVTTMWLLAIVAVLLGTSVNCFTLITASVSETYGPERTASVTGVINTCGQLVGATALAVSGYLGVAMAAGDDSSLAEYQGVWLSGMVTVAMTAGLGTAIHVRSKGKRQRSEVKVEMEKVEKVEWRAT